MRGTWVLAVLAAGGVACGGGNGNGKDKVTSVAAQPVTAPAVPVPVTEPAAEGPACAEMAEQVITTIVAERGEKHRARAPAMTEVVRKRCEEDRWSAESRRCMAGAATRGDAKRCFEQLTPAQQEAMERAEAELSRGAKGEAVDGAAAAPSVGQPSPPPPPAPMKAPEKEMKKRSKSAAPKPDRGRSDPCEGGE